MRIYHMDNNATVINDTQCVINPKQRMYGMYVQL